MADHTLHHVAHFTHLTGPGSGVTQRVPLDTPYWRYYCECGAVGGRAPTEAAARAAHRTHVATMTEVLP